MSKGMKRIIVYGSAFLALIIALALILPFVIPVDTYRSRIEQTVGNATGRTLRIDGPLRLTIFPQLGLSASDVRFSNKTGGMAFEMAAAGNVQIAVALLPLLKGDIQVATIVLDKPVINLEVDKNGEANWTFATNKAPSQSGAALPQGLHFSGIQIMQGRIGYANAITGKTRVLENLDATIDVTDQNQPVAIQGRLTQAGRTVDFNGQLATPQTLSAGAATTIKLSLSGELLQAGFTGEIASDRAVSGDLTLKTSSLRQLGTWLGAEMPSGGGMALTSHVASRNGLTTLSDMSLALDGMSIRGTLAADTNGELTAVKGQLSVNRLDLNSYMQASAQSATKTSGWSSDPIALDTLKKINADLTVSTGSLIVRNLRIGQSSVVLRLQNGFLRADLNPITLYGGVGQSVLTADLRGATPLFRNTLKFEKVAVATLLGDAIGVNKIEGNGTLVLDITSQGKSANAIMHAMNGKGSIAVGKGKIRGVNLGMVARTIQTVLSGSATSDAASTEFTEINGSFVIADGVLTNRDFRLAGPGLNASGEGLIDLGNQTMDFKIMPRANLGVTNIGVPFRISGPWSGLRYRPDLEGLAKGVINDLARSPASAKDLLGNILGRPNASPAQPGGNMLDNIFGR